MLFVFDFSVYYLCNIVYVQSTCINSKGHAVNDGTYFIPYEDACRFCQCADNEPIGCVYGPCVFPPPPVCRF